MANLLRIERPPEVIDFIPVDFKRKIKLRNPILKGANTLIHFVEELLAQIDIIFGNFRQSFC